MTIGALIYLLYGLFSKPGGGKPDNTITITAGEIDWLETSWKKRWRRPPTPEERQGLIKGICQGKGRFPIPLFGLTLHLKPSQ